MAPSLGLVPAGRVLVLPGQFARGCRRWERARAGPWETPRNGLSQAALARNESFSGKRKRKRRPQALDRPLDQASLG